MNSIIKGLGFICMILCMTGTLAACGKKMTPTPPEGSTYPRQYPKP
jgi:hypothetical protein